MPPFTASAGSASHMPRETALMAAMAVAAATRGDRRSASNDEDLAFDLHRNVERQLRHADGATRVGANVPAEDFDDEVGEAVDHGRLLVESRRGIHHAEHAHP